MITQNELFDLSFALTLIRNNIDNGINIAVLDAILGLFEKPNASIQDNDIRKVLRGITNLDEKWEFAKHDNYYVRTVIFKEADMLNLLMQNLSELRMLLQSRQFEQAYDLADILHVLPEVIATNKGRVSHGFMKTFIKPYQKKWKPQHISLPC